MTTASPEMGGAQGGAPPSPTGGTPPTQQQQEPPANGGEQQRPYVRTGDLPDDALKARLDQAKRAAAAEARAAAFKELGVEDPDKFKTDRDATAAKLKRYEDAEEKRKRAEMSEAQRYKVDLERVTAENVELKKRLQDLEETQVFSTQEQVVTQVASKHVSPKFLRFARNEFVMHLNELAKTDAKALDEMSERDVSRWFRKFAADFPEMAAAAPTTAPTGGAQPPAGGTPPPKPPEKKPDPPPTPTRRLIGQPPTRSGAPKPVPPTGGDGEKTFKPGQKNSMSKAEVAAAMRAKGMRPY